MSGLRPVVVVEVPGVTEELLERALPSLRPLAERGGLRPLKPMLPAVSSAVRATLLTGLAPRQHGCVGEGWYSRDSGELCAGGPVDALVKGERVWETGRRLDRRFTCARLFWSPGAYGPRDWAPEAAAGSAARRAAEIARVALEDPPTLALASLPHAEWALRRLGPASPALAAALEPLDAALSALLAALAGRARVVLVTSYAFSDVERPVALNRFLREEGLVRVRRESGAEVLDPAASDAFALAEGQVAHLYLRRPEDAAALKARLEAVPGVDFVLDEEGKTRLGLDHPRSGDLVAVSEADRWFAGSCGPETPAPRPGWRAAWEGVRGSLGLRGEPPADLWARPRGANGRAASGAVVLSTEAGLLPERALSPHEFKSLILRHVFERDLEEARR